MQDRITASDTGGKGKEHAEEIDSAHSENTMTEKDRHIITFGGDDDLYEESYSPSNGDFSAEAEAPQDVEPEVHPYGEYSSSDAAEAPAAEDPADTSFESRADTTAAPRDVYKDTNYPEEESSFREASDSARDAMNAADEQELHIGDYINDAAYDYQEETPQSDAGGSYSDSSSYYNTPYYSYDEEVEKKTRDKRYVTKGVLAICLIITMVVSSVLGALFGAIFGRTSANSASSSSSPGADSEMSQLSLSDATDSDLTIAQIVAKNENAVVEILVSGTSQNYFGQMEVTEGAGSGVIVNSNGYIVTNYHVIEGANKVQVTLHNGDTYSATIVGGDNDNDIAVIKINATDLEVAEIGDSNTVSVGDTAVAIGNPLGQLGGTATTGIISALDRKLTIDGRTLSLLQTDAAINGGNSGGGLFNSKGELIGIVDAKSSGVGIEGLAFAIPINSVADIINDLIENGKVSAKPAIGIMIQDVSEENAQYYNLEAAGVYIAQVTGDNAQRAGFQQGDRIISLNGESIESSSDLISKVRSCKVGDTVSVVVSRSGQEIEIKTVLEETTTIE